MEKTAKRSRMAKIFGIFIDIILGCVILVGLLIAVFSLVGRAQDGIPSFFGKAVLTVQSESMTGTFDKGDIIIVDKFSKDSDVKTNQFSRLVPDTSIVTFYYDIDSDGTDDVVTHLFKGTTVIGTQKLYQFQGTYNPENHQLGTQNVAANKLIGVYTGAKVACLGTALDFLRSPLGFGLVIMLPIFAFFVYALVRLILVLHERNHEKTLMVSEASISPEERERIKREIMEELRLKGDYDDKENQE